MPTDRTMVAAHGRVVVREEHEGRVARLVLASPPENAIDVDLLSELNRALDALSRWPDLACVVLEGGGREFSSGLSLTQRRPPAVETLLSSFHLAARQLAALDAVLVSIVRGRCLGAGFELALLSHAIVCDATAKFGFPELAFGAFPMLGSLLLPRRLPAAKAEELILSARTLATDEAVPIGLVTECAGGWDNAESLANRWISANVLSRSNVAVRAWARASRLELRTRLGDELSALEELYLGQIADSRDASEGIQAALHRRDAKWTHR